MALRKMRFMEMYLTLFTVSFLAATLIPAGSEVLLLSLAAQGEPVLWLWLVATSGNLLGSMINYALGRYLLHFQHRRWFPLTPKTLEKSQAWFQRYGLWSLLFSWLPLVGDPLTVVAGVLRVRFYWFVLLVGLGKATRYAVLLGLLELWQG